MLSGTLAGAEDVSEIRRWALLHRDFLRRFLPFARGIPGHDALNDVMNALDAELFGTCFTQWVSSVSESLAEPGAGPEVVAIDGRTSRRTPDRTRERNPLHPVSAWASGQRLVLGQQACEAKSNEITAILGLRLPRLALAHFAWMAADRLGSMTARARDPIMDACPSLHPRVPHRQHH